MRRNCKTALQSYMQPWRHLNSTAMLPGAAWESCWNLSVQSAGPWRPPAHTKHSFRLCIFNSWMCSFLNVLQNADLTACKCDHWWGVMILSSNSFTSFFFFFKFSAGYKTNKHWWPQIKECTTLGNTYAFPWPICFTQFVRFTVHCATKTGSVCRASQSTLDLGRRVVYFLTF